MIYLDNAATTDYKPRTVIDAVNRCLTECPFNANRGNNKYALALQQSLLEMRQKLSLLYRNGNAMHVAFTSGCTAALNLAVLGNARRGHIVISATEHNSVLRPVMQLKKRGFVTVSVVQPDEFGQISLEQVQKVWKNNTYMLCVSHASNVTGTRQQLVGLGDFAHKHNAVFLVDCAQSVGYFTADMEKDNIDLLAIGGHKGLHAMQGAGALLFSDRAAPRPITFGGTGTESDNYYQPQTLPEGLESGTLPTPALLAMNAGVDFWIQNWQQNEQNVAECQTLILDGLKRIPNVLVYSEPNKSGVCAFNVATADSSEVSDILAEKFDIVVRGGLQCAPLMHKHLGTFNQGVVRASVSCVTEKSQCLAFLNAVDQIAKHYR